MAARKIMLRGIESIEVKRPGSVSIVQQEEDKEELLEQFTEEPIEEIVIIEDVPKEKIPWWLRWVERLGYDLIKRKKT